MKNVLKREKDFDYVFSKGKRASSRTLTIVYVKADELKAGFCVGKKHGKAHIRNYIKRLLRNAFHVYSLQLDSYYIAIIPKVKESYSLKEYIGDMNYLFSKENLLK